MNKIIIVGSSRNDGDTATMSQELINQLKCDSIDLNDYNFSYFDYKHNNRNDDYLKLMTNIVEKYVGKH